MKQYQTNDSECTRKESRKLAHCFYFKHLVEGYLIFYMPVTYTFICTTIKLTICSHVWKFITIFHYSTAQFYDSLIWFHKSKYCRRIVKIYFSFGTLRLWFSFLKHAFAETPDKKWKFLRTIKSCLGFI